MLHWSKIKSKRTIVAIGAFFALTGLIYLFEPIDTAVTSGANVIRSQPASGEFVIVGMDDNLQAEQAAWPWSQEDIASTIDLVFEAGASKVVLSHEIPLNGSGLDDRLSELIRSNPDRLYIVEPTGMGDSRSEGRFIADKAFVSSVTPVHAQLALQFWGGVEYDFYALESNGRVVSSAAAKLTDQPGELNQYYPIDYAIDARTIPYVSLGLLHSVEQSRSILSGKTAILGFEAPPNAKPVKLLGQGQFGLATLIAMQAETLKQGRPVMLHWSITWAAGLLLCFLILQSKRVSAQLMFTVMALVGSFFLMVLMNSWGVRFEIANGWVMIIVSGIAGASRNLREKTRLENAVHPVSGLPSTDALRTLEHSDLTLVHMKIRRSSELLDILESAQQKVLAYKVADLVSPERAIWHGDDGRFYWLASDFSAETADQHFQSLALIFRNGFVIDELNVSLEVVFGIDERTHASMTDRVRGATLSAKQAIISRVQWQPYTQSDRSAATWSVTLLKELDLAIENGHVDIALQPKLNLKTGEISGAEALARWHHPTRGFIQPDEFINQAEKGGRLLALTSCVLGKGLDACSEEFARDPSFVLSVNIAPSMLENTDLPSILAQELAKHRVPASNVMLEITESGQFANDEICASTMHQLREQGFHLSIDDYGTANSTLEYLRKIPAGELKIDRKFVQNMLENEADYHLVASTIQLAHRLNMLVVAEGVEEIDTLSTLKSLNCDIIQGYLIAKPMKPKDFIAFVGRRAEEGKTVLAV